jgi:formylglycine-generating enzyme required for sulfatase activity
MFRGHLPLATAISLSVAACANSTRTPEPNPPASTTIASARPSASVPSTAPSSSARTPDAGATAVADASPEAGVTVVPEDMAGVPGGTFIMGWEGRGGQRDEQPAHPVTLKPFLLDKTEVTNEAYLKCVAANVCREPMKGGAAANKFGSDEKFRGPRQPISSVSQSDAATYCTWVGKRLPTEAEFERAARGSDQRMYPWGNTPPTRELTVFGASVTEDVGSHPQGVGPYGHHDMAGNVWEWSADMYDPYAYRRPGASQGIVGSCDEIMAALKELQREKQQGFTGSNPIPDECEHTLRGGAFNYDAFGLRSSNRVHHPGKFRLIMSGVRCAKDWPDGPVDTAGPADAGVVMGPLPAAGPAKKHKKHKN